MTQQPDTFELVKKRWREPRYQTKEGYTLEHDHDFQTGREVCADELESGLEQQVRELRDECLDYDTEHHEWFARELTALLGDPNERT